MACDLTPLLRTVRQPGRYVGNEYLLPDRPHRPGTPSVVLAFPDLYEIGMSHWGSQLLFWENAERNDLDLDRAYLPAPDLEAQLRARQVPLTGIASGRPLKEFTLVGISLQHELAWSSVLALLDLGGIPLLSADRGDEHPLVIVGGPGIANPLPGGPFIDAFLVGDGEGFIAECLAAGVLDETLPRAERLKRLAALPGVWVPARGLTPVAARRVPDLEASFHPRRMLVPNFRIVQERAVVELARGCPFQCRFCQAHAVYAPYRQRSPELVRELARELLRATGYDKLSLLALNTSAYPDLTGLVTRLQAELAPQRASVILPSQHIAALDPAALPALASVRKSGLTLAPESASAALRQRLNKHLTDEQLVAICAAAARAGWRLVKLYFMIGLPGETMDDVAAIARLVRSLPSKLEFNVTISPFVPKPHTPLQWCGMAPRAELDEKAGLIRRTMPRRAKISVHSGRQSLLEAVFARGGSELAPVLLAAYRAGARLDSWTEYFRFDLWQQSFAAAGLDLDALATRPLAPDAPLPWDHLSYGADRDCLRREYAAATGIEG